MTVGELNKLLLQFPPELPVFFCPHTEGLDDDHAVVLPEDAVMNLVTRSRLSAMGFKGDNESNSQDDAVVIYPVNVRDKR